MSTAHSPSRHRHPLSPAQQELREAVKRSAERRRPPPNLSVRISPSPQASERDREPALSSTYGRLSERMADRSTPRWLGRQSLSSAMAQATASELEKIRVEEGIMHKSIYGTGIALDASSGPLSTRALSPAPSRATPRSAGPLRAPPPNANSVVTLLPEPSPKPWDEDGSSHAVNTAAGTPDNRGPPPVVSFPLTGGGASVQVSQRHFSRMEADLQRAMAKAGAMFDDGVTLEQMHNREVESEVVALRRLVGELKAKMVQTHAGNTFFAKRIALEWWLKAHGRKRRMQVVVSTRRRSAEFRTKKNALRYWRVGRGMGRIVERARGSGRRGALVVCRGMEFLCRALAFRRWRGVTERFRDFWRRRREAMLGQAASSFYFWKNRKAYEKRVDVLARRKNRHLMQVCFSRMLRFCFVLKVGVRRTRTRILRRCFWGLKKHSEWNGMEKMMRKKGAFGAWRDAQFQAHCIRGDANGRARGKRMAAAARCIRAWDELMERNVLTRLMNDGRIEALKTRLITAPMGREFKRQSQATLKEASKDLVFSKLRILFGASPISAFFSMWRAHVKTKQRHEKGVHKGIMRWLGYSLSVTFQRWKGMVTRGRGGLALTRKIEQSLLKQVVDEWKQMSHQSSRVRRAGARVLDKWMRKGIAQWFDHWKSEHVWIKSFRKLCFNALSRVSKNQMKDAFSMWRIAHFNSKARARVTAVNDQRRRANIHVDALHMWRGAVRTQRRARWLLRRVMTRVSRLIMNEWHSHAKMWFMWRAITTRRCFAGWKEEWRGSKLLDGIGFMTVRRYAVLRGLRLVRGWHLWALRCGQRRKRLLGVEGRIARRSGIRVRMMVFGSWRDLMLRSVYVKQRVAGPKGSTSIVTRRVIARGTPVWRTPIHLVLSAWEAYTKTRGARSLGIVTYGWTDVYLSLGFVKWWSWLRRRRTLKVRGGQLDERSKRGRVEGAMWGWHRRVRGMRLSALLRSGQRRSFAVAHLLTWWRRGVARGRGRASWGTRRCRNLAGGAVRAWMEVSRVRRKQRWLVTGILTRIVDRMILNAFWGWNEGAWSIKGGRHTFLRQAISAWLDGIVWSRREAQGERRARQRDKRVNVRKYMAPMFDRWRQATVLGWRHRRGVEKLRIVSQERVCRAWFEKRQEEKRRRIMCSVLSRASSRDSLRASWAMWSASEAISRRRELLMAGVGRTPKY